MGVNPWFLTAREGPRACSDGCSGWRRVGTQNSGGSIPRTLSLPADSQLLELRGRLTGQEARGSHGNTPRKQALGSSTRHLSGQLPPWGGGVGELGQVMHATPHSTPTETRCGRPLLPPKAVPTPQPAVSLACTELASRGAGRCPRSRCSVSRGSLCGRLLDLGWRGRRASASRPLRWGCSSPGRDPALGHHSPPSPRAG